MNDEQEARLVSIHRDQLRPEDLSKYFFAAAYPESGSSFRYYLPRIIDFLAYDPDANRMLADDLVLVWDRLNFSRALPDWNEEADAVLQKFCHAVTKVLIAAPDPEATLTLGAALRLFSRGGIDVGPLVDQIESTPPVLRARAVALWFSRDRLFVNHDPDCPPKFENNLWRSDCGTDGVLSFISDLNRLREMEDAFFAETDNAWSKFFSLAEEELRYCHGLWHQR